MMHDKTSPPEFEQATVRVRKHDRQMLKSSNNLVFFFKEFSKNKGVNVFILGKKHGQAQY